MKRFVATLFLGLFAPSAWAQEAVCEPAEPARVENRDGSVLTVRTEAPFDSSVEQNRCRMSYEMMSSEIPAALQAVLKALLIRLT